MIKNSYSAQEDTAMISDIMKPVIYLTYNTDADKDTL